MWMTASRAKFPMCSIGGSYGSRAPHLLLRLRCWWGQRVAGGQAPGCGIWWAWQQSATVLNAFNSLNRDNINLPVGSSGIKARVLLVWLFLCLYTKRVINVNVFYFIILILYQSVEEVPLILSVSTYKTSRQDNLTHFRVKGHKQAYITCKWLTFKLERNWFYFWFSNRKGQLRKRKSVSNQKHLLTSFQI